MVRTASLVLTVVTGFTGLVYEVAWQKYLATLLGSHSEATAAILALFLGGLSIGYRLFGDVTRRLVASARAASSSPRLLVFYGLVEAAIGLWALAFPWLFAGVRSLSLLVPHEATGAGFAFDVFLASLLVAPPAILMGGTIPILTQALARSLADATRFHAFVYAFNTAGAFAGALAAGYLLVPLLGLDRLLFWMATLNLGAGAVFLAMGLPRREIVALEPGEGPPRIEGLGTYAGAALLVGFAMIAVQTVLIRVAGLAFGSSQFTFSMVVAVFVLCIALGSFAVSLLPRIGRAHVVASHWLLVLACGVVYLNLDGAPYWAHALRTLFRDTDAAFHAYYLAGLLGLGVAIGPAVVLSGASLPLLFHQLRREVGELGAAAGRLYSWNTVGSLLGALLGGYLLLFWLDLHHVFRIAIGALALAAALLTARLYASPGRGVRGAVAGGTVVAVAALMALPSWSPELLTIGLFRSRQPGKSAYIGVDKTRAIVEVKHPLKFHDDDPTTTVSVREEGKGPSLERSIFTNGKSDGSTRDDYTTMALAGILPALLADEHADAFVIGYGTGVTAGELAALPGARRVTVAEISLGVIEAAPLFDFANQGASRNPKLEIVRSDAYRALLRSDARFDVIASEPSNPWVTGVEMLFSREFLAAARDRLNPGGVYAQWFHQYETDDETIAMVIRTYASVFDHVAVWYALGADLLLLGFQSGDGPLDLERLERRVAEPHFAAALGRSGIEGLPELLAHELLPLGVVGAAGLEGPTHTLLHPRLNHVAGRAFFRGGAGSLPFTGSGPAARIGRENSLLRRYAARSGGRLPEGVLARVAREACTHRADLCGALVGSWQRAAPVSPVRDRLVASAAQRQSFGGPLDVRAPQRLSTLFDARLLGSERVPLLEARNATEAYTRFYSHAVPFDPRALVSVWRRCHAPRAPQAFCKEGLARAEALVAGRPASGRTGAGSPPGQGR